MCRRRVFFLSDKFFIPGINQLPKIRGVRNKNIHQIVFSGKDWLVDM